MPRSASPMPILSLSVVRALPNYGLDPEALTANFNIYKGQNAYDNGEGEGYARL